MKNFSSLVLLSSIFLLTVVLGLNTAVYILPLMYPSDGTEPVMQPVVEDPQEVGNVAYIFLMIIIVTAIMLFLMKRKMAVFINVLLMFSFYTGTMMTLAPILGDPALIVSLVLIAFYAYDVFKRKRTETLLAAFVLLLTLSGVGAYLGASLGLIPALALIVVMATYDFIAVFITKHMVELAKGAKQGVNLMFIIPVNERAMGLGAGDIALPTAFTISVFAEKGLSHAIPTALGGLMGLIWLFYYIINKREVTLPALPPIVCGLLFGYGLSWVVLG